MRQQIHRLVFLDKTGTTTKMTRRTAYLTSELRRWGEIVKLSTAK